MAAPDSTPELTVVPAGAGPTQSAPKRPEAVARKSEPRKAERKGAPWWLVIVVGVVGLILFVTQFQRAERLDSRVASLSEELAATDQRLEIANLHLTAYQSHLGRVRASVAALSDQVFGLQALAERDPLAPVVSEAPSSAGSASSDSEIGPSDAATGDAVADPILGEADDYSWQTDSTSTVPFMSDADRRAIVDGAVGTSFTRN